MAPRLLRLALSPPALRLCDLAGFPMKWKTFMFTLPRVMDWATFQDSAETPFQSLGPPSSISKFLFTCHPYYRGVPTPSPGPELQFSLQCPKVDFSFRRRMISSCAVLAISASRSRPAG
ncbi:hypothetical protein B0H12DRAFT_751365 [Mycena haematopus]|nr:hypothetical protein B0H12DRAFT_751365 [Mycena haematopus]